MNANLKNSNDENDDSGSDSGLSIDEMKANQRLSSFRNIIELNGAHNNNMSSSEDYMSTMSEDTHKDFVADLQETSGRMDHFSRNGSDFSFDRDDESSQSNDNKNVKVGRLHLRNKKERHDNPSSCLLCCI